jgi:hypothetical protein
VGGFPWGKLVVAVVLVWLLGLLAGGVVLLMAAALLAVLWRWPRLGWGAFIGLLLATIAASCAIVVVR